MRKLQRRRRAGFTTMELVFVLAIIIIVTAISVPVISTIMSDMSVTAAGDRLRALLAETRANAMSDGVPWRLAFNPNTGIYQMAPEDSAEWSNAAMDSAQQSDLLRDSLPKEIVMSLRQEDIMGSDKALPAGGNWETIAIFDPIGAARDDTLIYYGKPGSGPDRIRVRGLTGAVSVENFNLFVNPNGQ